MTDREIEYVMKLKDRIRELEEERKKIIIGGDVFTTIVVRNKKGKEVVVITTDENGKPIYHEEKGYNTQFITEWELKQ